MNQESQKIQSCCPTYQLFGKNKHSERGSLAAGPSEKSTFNGLQKLEAGKTVLQQEVLIAAF